jgi:DNA-binding NarL/FixJ family response regulator
VLLVDDSQVFLDAAARLLAGDRRIEVVGRAGSGAEALERLAGLSPDLVVVDWDMPGMNGLELSRRLKEQNAPPRVLMLTLHDLTEYRAAAAPYADGFLAKSATATDLLGVVHRLCPNGGPA